MRKEDNLIPFTGNQSREEAAKNGRKGGIRSGASRRQQADLKKALQSILSGVYKDGDQTRSGAEMIALALFKGASNPEARNFIGSVTAVIKLLGLDKDALDQEEQRARIEKLRSPAFNEADDGVDLQILIPDNGRGGV